MTTIAPRDARLTGIRGLSADIVLPGDAGWDPARQAWNLVADQRPAAVALPADAHEVAEVVAFAADAGLQVAPQGTGHNAIPLGDLSGTILLRTERMRDVRIDAGRRIARVGAGALWEDVVGPAAAAGLATLHGSSPDVGVVGYTLGGGIGWLARRHGLAANAVTAVEVVTADGERVRADADHEPDLFWAIRGGGGNFGVVTALEFRLFPITSAYAGWLIFPWERSEQVLRAWTAWTEDVPDEVTSVGRILQLPPLEVIPEPLRGRNLVVVEAAYAGDEEAGRALMAPLRALAPEMDTFQQMPIAGLVRLHADPEGPTPGIGLHNMLDAFPGEAVSALVDAVGPGSGSVLLSSEVRHLGGALARPAAGAGALSHLDAANVTYFIGLPMAPGQAEVIHEHAARAVAALSPWDRGRAYLNFSEAPTDTATAFDDGPHRRLREARARYDASGVIRANHRIEA